MFIQPSFPDQHITIEENSPSATGWVSRSHGPLPTKARSRHPATGKSIVVAGIFRVADGKIAEEWMQEDFGIYQQLTQADGGHADNDNQAVVRRYYDEVVNGAITPSSTNSSPPTTTRTTTTRSGSPPEGVKQFIGGTAPGSRSVSRSTTSSARATWWRLADLRERTRRVVRHARDGQVGRLGGGRAQQVRGRQDRRRVVQLRPATAPPAARIIPSE